MTLNADLTLTQSESGYRATLVLPAHETQLPAATELCMSLVHPLDPHSLRGARLAERQGDWHRLVLDTPWLGDAPLTLAFGGATPLKKVTDHPYGLYLVAGGQTRPVRLAGAATRTLMPAEPMPAGRVAFVPQPDRVALAEGALPCPERLHLAGERWNRDWLERLWGRLSGVSLPHLAESGYPVRAEHRSGLDRAFELDVSADGMALSYRDEPGFRAGQAYVMQYLVQWPLAGRLPACSLAGEPAYGYRGVHLDVVRHFFSAQTIRDWFDLFALFQFNHFHWHLTDDDGWRVESEAYPALADIGAWRGHGLPLPPQMGSGPAPYGGCYSAADIRRTVARAESLGIEVVPEMDIPGHARALLKALPELVEPDDASRYVSVQHHDDNVLNPALAATDEVVRTLIGEWCELFPGALFHLGSDEVPEGAWLRSPAALAWAERQGRSPSDLHGEFMARMEAVVREHGKTAMGWEEIRTGERVSHDTWILSWQGVEAGQAAADAGHPVVMTPAQNCYFDLAVTDRSDDPGYYWAGTVSLSDVWHYDPVAGLSGPGAERVRGVQSCLWTEVVATPDQAEFMWFPRLLGLAEVAWGSNRHGDYSEFRARAGHWMTVLAHLGVAGRNVSMGW